MKTRTRVIRPLFYQSTILFGVRLGDWKFIGGAAVAAFCAALLFRLQIKGLHLAFPLAIFSTLAGASFFNWVRVNHRPRWLEQQIAYLWRRFFRLNEHLDRQPVKANRRACWLIGGDEITADAKSKI